MSIRLGLLLTIVSLLAGVLEIYKDRELIPQLACSTIRLVGESSYCPQPIPPTPTDERKTPTEDEIRLPANQSPADSVTSSFPSSNPYYFVWDTRPPDDWLSLWERPYANGRLIRHMRNGTTLELLEKGPDKWYKFRIIGTGEVGWTAWGNDTGSRIWIYCCRTLDALPSYPQPYRG